MQGVFDISSYISGTSYLSLHAICQGLPAGRNLCDKHVSVQNGITAWKLRHLATPAAIPLLLACSAPGAFRVAVTSKTVAVVGQALLVAMARLPQ